MITYYTQLETIPDSTDFYQTIIADTTSLTFHFTWKEEVEEVYREYLRALKARASADPFINLSTGDILRDYDFLTMYMSTIPHSTVTEVQEWIEEYGYIPQSLRSLYSDTTIDILAQQVYDTCREAEALDYYLEPLRNQLRWNVEISAGTESVTGVVESGGWLNTQSRNWQVQFVADRSIGREDLGYITIRIEVPENA